MNLFFPCTVVNCYVVKWTVQIYKQDFIKCTMLLHCALSHLLRKFNLSIKGNDQGLMSSNPSLVNCTQIIIQKILFPSLVQKQPFIKSDLSETEVCWLSRVGGGGWTKLACLRNIRSLRLVSEVSFFILFLRALVS